MQVKTVAVLAHLSVGALAVSECPAGQKLKKDLKNLFCTSSTEDAASCGGHCCEDDELTCGGLAARTKNPKACKFGSYGDNNDAWKSKVTTEKNFHGDCCKPVATCANTLFECPAGQKRSTAVGTASIKCPGGPSSCASVAQCCTKASLTCGGITDADLNGGGTLSCTGKTVKGSDDAWKEISLPASPTLAVYQSNCCGAVASCSTMKCSAGKKLKSTAATLQCTGTVCTKAADEANCCDPDGSVCAGTTPSCTASQYYPSKRIEWQTRDQSKCCTAKATCAAAKCKAGYRMKKNVEMLSCTGDHLSCAEGNICCELDTTTCGGQVGISCPYGTYDESTAWPKDTTEATKDAWKNKAATAATKHTSCCTPLAACSSGVTTTPAPAVTATPNAPARRYSEHKVAVSKKDSSNPLLLVVGAFAGMATLFTVQSIRRRSNQAESGSRELAAE